MSCPTVRSAGGSGAGSSGTVELLDERRQRRASASSASSIRQVRSGSATRSRSTRTSSAGTPASTAARSTPKPSIASISHGRSRRPARVVPIGTTCASGIAARRRACDQSRLGRDAKLDPGRVVRVAVDRLASRSRATAARTSAPRRSRSGGARPVAPSASARRRRARPLRPGRSPQTSVSAPSTPCSSELGGRDDEKHGAHGIPHAVDLRGSAHGLPLDRSRRPRVRGASTAARRRAAALRRPDDGASS